MENNGLSEEELQKLYPQYRVSVKLTSEEGYKILKTLMVLLFGMAIISVCLFVAESMIGYSLTIFSWVITLVAARVLPESLCKLFTDTLKAVCELINIPAWINSFKRK